MRKIIVLLLMLCILQSTFAQNWKLINSYEKYNYTSKNFYYTIFVDSTKEINGDSVFFLNKVTRKVKPSSNGTNYYQEKQSQFLLSKIIYRSKDALLQNNDSVKFLIKQYSKLNDTWVFDSLQHDTAKVIEVSTATIFGNVDSVKIIQLSHSDTIVLSKNYGILQFPVYDSLPQHVNLVGIEGRNLGQSIPKFNEFFDFNIGDVFYYKQNTHDGYKGTGQIDKKITIKNKLIQANKVIYTADYTEKKSYHYYFPDHFVTSYFTKEDSVISFQDDTSHYLNKFPNQPVGGTHPNSKFKPINVYHDQKWQTIVKSYSNKRACLENNLIIESDEGCLGALYVEKVGMTYGKGIGHISLYSWFFGTTVYSNEEMLVGCIKNGKVFGTVIPDSVFLTVPQSNKLTNFKLYPNPAQTSFTIEPIENKKQDVYIYDAQGAQVIKEKMHGRSEIDIRNLSNGVYFVKIVGDESVDVIKILKR